MSTFGGIRHSPSTFTSSPASTTLFRRLVWEGTVPLEIRVDSKELPANSNRGLECYFIQAPRVSYLPLLTPEIKRFLQDVVFDDEAARLMKEEEWWFESEDGLTLKWYVWVRFPAVASLRLLDNSSACRHWPVGLIYDNHTTLATSRTGTSASARAQAVPLRLILHLASPPTEKLLLAPSAEACKQAFMGQLKEADFLRWGNTKRMTGLRKAEQDGMWEGIKERSSSTLPQYRTHVR